MTSPQIAPAYEAITEDHVRQALRDASIRQLATALDPGAFKGDHGPDGFACPDCSAWAAVILDDWRWTCTWCTTHPATTVSGQSTRLGLASRVADRYDACLRLVHAIAGPGVLRTPRRARSAAGGRLVA